MWVFMRKTAAHHATIPHPRFPLSPSSHFLFLGFTCVFLRHVLMLLFLGGVLSFPVLILSIHCRGQRLALWKHTHTCPPPCCSRSSTAFAWSGKEARAPGKAAACCDPWLWWGSLGPLDRTPPASHTQAPFPPFSPAQICYYTVCPWIT